MFQNYNPPSVVVVLVPIRKNNIGMGLLTVGRWTITEPSIALPGGFQEMGETWQDAGIREVREETGQIIDTVELIDVVTVPATINLIFCKSNIIEFNEDAPFDRNEVAWCKVIHEPVECAFPTHTKKMKEFFDSIGY